MCAVFDGFDPHRQLIATEGQQGALGIEPGGDQRPAHRQDR
jgi:hypothetical protein